MYAGTMDAGLPCCLTYRTVACPLGFAIVLQPQQRYHPSLQCAVAHHMEVFLPYHIYQFLQATSQVLCVSNFSVGIVEENFENFLSSAVNTILKR